MKTSSVGIELIKRNEGCRLKAYLDTIANPPVWTIGYGDTLNVYEGLVITQQEAEDRLASRLANEFEPAVSKVCTSKTTQPQFDAMVSLAWNIGIGAFAKSSVARFHKAGSYAKAADAFLAWNKAGGVVIPGLTRRRTEERALYLSSPSETPLPAPAVVDRDLLADLIRAVQRVVGADPDGIYGPNTSAAIKKAQSG